MSERDHPDILVHDWIVIFTIFAAVSYTDLLYFHVISEHYVDDFQEGFEKLHAAIMALLRGEVASEPPQARMLPVWLYYAIYSVLDAVLANSQHVIRLAVLAMEAAASAFAYVAFYAFSRLVVRGRLHCLLLTALFAQASLAAQFVHPFGGYFRHGFFFLGLYLALSMNEPERARSRPAVFYGSWVAFYALASTYRYDVAMLVALIAFVIALYRRSFGLAALHVAGVVTSTAVYQGIRALMGMTDTMAQNLYEVDASGTQFRATMALENLSFPVRMILLFNVGLIAFAYTRKSFSWPERIVLAGTLVYSVFLVFVGSHVESRLWLPLAGVLMVLAFKALKSRGEDRAAPG